MTINVEVIRSILQDLRGCWKHKFLKKKANFPVKKRFLPIFSRVIQCDNSKRTNCKGPKGILTFIVDVIRPFLQERRGCWKNKFLKKKAIFPVKKRFWPFSSRNIEHHKRQRTTFKGPQGNLTINVEVIRPFLQDPRGCWKHKILKKKAIFPVKRLWPTSSRIMEHDKHQRTTYRGPQGNMTPNVEVKRSFLQDLRGWKQSFLKKRQSFQWKDFGLFFLALSNLTNVREQPSRVHKVNRRLLWKLLDHFLRT